MIAPAATAPRITRARSLRFGSSPRRPELLSVPIDSGPELGERVQLNFKNRLGRGATAEVYRAFDAESGTDVAVKLGFDRLDGPTDRLHREAAVLASLQHPSIIRFIASGTVSSGPFRGRPFLVQELAYGNSLAMVTRTGVKDLTLVAGWAEHLFGALAHLHAAGLVHRDIKPGNLMLSGLRRSPVRLIDLGIAAAVGAAPEPGISSGTVRYMSPEQAGGGNTLPAWDIYAMGLVLLELLTGTQAFPGTAIESLVSRTLREPELPDFLNPEWREFLRSLTAMDGAARPTAAEASRVAFRLARRTA